MAKPTRSRRPLDRARVLRAALALLDRDGLEALSMRRLGQALGVEAMSLYGHVAGKEDILDGVADLVVGEFAVPARRAGWKSALRRRALRAHEVLLRHPWASTLIESRVNTGPIRLRDADAVLGTLRAAGFPIELAYHAFLTLDSYLYGFTLQELSWPFPAEERSAAVANARRQMPAGAYPHLEEMIGYALSRPAARTKRTPYAAEFAFGLELILDGIERARR
jgi:AcrR family transcriptional regulator